jgi:hypothetical protein
MCGQFNDVIADYALSNLIEMGISEDKWMLMSVGIRVDGRLQDAGYPVQKHLSLPGSVSGISSKVQMMVMTLEAWRLNRGCEHSLPVLQPPYLCRDISPNYGSLAAHRC